MAGCGQWAGASHFDSNQAVSVGLGRFTADLCSISLRKAKGAAQAAENVEWQACDQVVGEHLHLHQEGT